MMSASSSTPRQTRRTRIVCISDTHNCPVKLPKGDVLIHAGDLTNQGSYSELFRAVQWLEKADFEAKIVIAGNHDITLDHDFYSKRGSSFHHQDPQDPAKCLSLFTSSKTITYLQHRSAAVRLTRPNGPRTEFTVFGSPYSPEIGTWAFTYRRTAIKVESPAHEDTATASPSAAELWADVPLDADILVTHTPPYGHCDDSRGCRDLRETLGQVRPRLHVCGHVHHARGSERLRWETDGLSTGDCLSVEHWLDPNPDPTSAKMSLVDLTVRGGSRPLDFHDPAPHAVAQTGCGARATAADPAQRAPCGTSTPGTSNQDVEAGVGGGAGRDHDPDSPAKLGADCEMPGQTNTGVRAGRRETCVVNCAILATGWPHTGGKRFNKPIVVDIDLPVWG